jgi:hypothetical protein
MAEKSAPIIHFLHLICFIYFLLMFKQFFKNLSQVSGLWSIQFKLPNCNLVKRTFWCSFCLQKFKVIWKTLKSLPNYKKIITFSPTRWPCSCLLKNKVITIIFIKCRGYLCVGFISTTYFLYRKNACFIHTFIIIIILGKQIIKIFYTWGILGDINN